MSARTYPWSEFDGAEDAADDREALSPRRETPAELRRVVERAKKEMGS